MGWAIFWLLVLVAIMCIAISRVREESYRNGSGLFKNSEYNLYEKDDLCDKEYFHEDGMMK